MTIQLTEQVRDLMHHKFAVRDDAAVWTGSTNWTLDDFGAEENVIVRVDSREIADVYSAVFTALWATRQIDGTGEFDASFAPVGDTLVRPWFCPGRGRALSHRMADRVTTARRRVRVASPIITAGPILSALSVAARGRADVSGIVDISQTVRVLGQWNDGAPTWKAPVLEQVLVECGFAGKASSEDFGRPGSVRDTMHAKVLVVDDAVFVGSFNLSRSGEANAENVLEIEDPATGRPAGRLGRRAARALPAGGGGARRRRRARMTDPGRLDLRTLDEGGQRAEDVGGDDRGVDRRGPAHAGPRALRRAHPRPGRRRDRRGDRRGAGARRARAHRGP